MPDRDIAQLPVASGVRDGDLLIKWDSTQVSGQRTQSLTAAQFKAYLLASVSAGATGATGPATTLYAGTITTLPAGSPATVTVTGTAPSQYINIGVPIGNTGAQGIQGIQGPPGQTGSAGPAGQQGIQGPPNQLSIRNVTTGAPGSSAAATIQGAPPSQTLDLTIPTGQTGPTGAAANISSISANTLPPGSPATATLGGTAPNYTITFGIPQGTPGNGNGNVNSTGTIRTGALAIYNDTTGNVLKDGGLPATIATSGSASDLTTGTLPAGRFPALTGDVTTTAGSLTTTLAATTVTAGSYTLATVTFDAKGRATAASSATTTGTGSVVLAGSPALTGTPTAPTAATADNSTALATTAFVKVQGYTTTAQAAAAAPVQSVAGRTGAVTLAVADVSGAAPLASPAFTGTPTVPTATAGTSTTQAASTAFVATSYAPLTSPALTGTPTAPTATVGTNTTQIATTAFVLANSSSGGGFPSAFSTKSANYTVVTGDKNTLFSLTGSFTLSLPSASSFGAGNGIYLSKTDGNGVWAVTPASGTIDGLSSISVYEERFALVSDGTNWRSVNRPKGWISVGTTTVASNVSSVNFGVGFSDPELRDMEFLFDYLAPNVADYPVYRVMKGGSYVTTGYIGATSTNSSGTFGSGSSTSFGILSFSTSLSYVSGRLMLQNFASSIGYQRIHNEAYDQNKNSAGDFVQSTASAIQGLQVFMAGANSIIANSQIVQRGYRL